MKVSKNVLVLLSVAALILGFASCSKKPIEAQQITSESASVTKSEVAELTPTPVAPRELTVEEKLIASQWAFKYSAEGYGEYGSFFRFYEEDSVFGKIYYAGFSNNRMNFAGKYVIAKEPYDYVVYHNREDAMAKENEFAGTSPYTVILYDWDDQEMGRIGFDGEILYNAQDKDKAKIYATGSTPYAYVKNDGTFDDLVRGELPVAVMEFVADDEVTSTFQINHNHTYTDLVEAMVEGSWSAQRQETGEITFSFKPFDPTDHSAVVVISADKQKATYTAEGDTSISMSIPQLAVTTAYLFEGKAPTSYGRDADILLTALSDGTFSIVASVFGNSMELDKGSYSVVGGYKFTFESEQTGKIESSIVGSAIQINYAQTGTKLGDIETTLTVRK